MVPRHRFKTALEIALGRSPVVAVLGPRQCGKTTLARHLAGDSQATFFDLESSLDLQQLENPLLALSRLEGLVVIDEIQLRPELLGTLRVLVDREDRSTRFLILGSASPDLVRGSSESLAGRVEFVDLGGFDMDEVGTDQLDRLWIRGSFPRSFLAASSEDSVAWRQGFIRTFLVKDIPQLGIDLSPVTMQRFWTMLAHYHGQSWNASEIAGSLGVSDKTVRRYLDILTSTYMVRQLPPWFENIGKRQRRAPKVYLRDSGLVHTLLRLENREAVLGHPKCGATWEGLALEQILRRTGESECYFWGTHAGAELDLLLFQNGQRFGVEFKRVDAPRSTKSMRIAIQELALKHLWIVYPGPSRYPIDDVITAIPLADFPAVLDPEDRES